MYESGFTLSSLHRDNGITPFENQNIRCLSYRFVARNINTLTMKPGIVADEMFPEGGTSAIMEMDEETGGNIVFEMNEKNLQADFYNDFDDLNDDEDF